MATAPPPIFDFLNINYNQAFFNNNPSGYVTYAYANANYLKSIGIALSTATTTTFTGSVTIGGLLSLSGGISLTGGLTVDNLTVNGTSSFIGQSTFTLIPILPTGYQFINNTTQSISGIKTFTSLINTNGISDLVSISSPTITASTVCNAPYFNASNNAFTTSLYTTTITGNITITGYIYTNIIANSSSPLPISIYCGTMSLPASVNTQAGLQIGWNGLTGSTGETDFINLGQATGAAGGGFNFSTLSNSLTNSNLAFIGKYANQGLTLFAGCGKFRIDDHNGGAYYWTESQEGSTMYATVNGISTGLNFYCGNASAVLVNTLSLNSTSISPNINLNPLSTTTFNVSHPTTTLGNNISTNTTQYATVGYVNSNSGTSILSLNNTFSGKNTFLQPIQMTISGDITITAIGSAAGNNLTTSSGANSTFIGQSAGLLTQTTIGDTIIGGGSGQIIVGAFNSNTVLGSNSHYNGNSNTVIGANAGNASTTTAFSNSTCVGFGSLITASNQITLGRATENVVCPGGVNVGGVLTTGIINAGGVVTAGLVTVNDVLTTANQITQPLQGYNLTVSIVLTFLVPIVTYIPNAAGLTITYPIPSGTNVGQTFVVRRLGTGGGQTVSLIATGSPAVWLVNNSGTPQTSIGISTVWQWTFFSTGALFVQIA